MPRLALPLLVTALAACPARAATPQPANPSVELADPKDAAKPAAWEQNFWGDLAATFAWTTGNAKDGQRTLRVEVTAGGKEGDAK
jgi:hypothetical protein